MEGLVKPTEVLIEKVKSFLDIETSAYDSKLSMLVSGAKGKLTSEGVTIPEVDHEMFDSYAICVSCQVAKELDLDVDFDKLDRLYMQRIIPLKELLRYEKIN